VFTHAHVSTITFRVDVYRSRPIGASVLTSAGMPGPEGPAHSSWLGVVTGILLIQISTGGVLVTMKCTFVWRKKVLRCAAPGRKTSVSG